MPLSGRRGSYGVDAPYMLIVPFAILVFNITAGVINRSPWPLVGAGLLLLCAATGLHASRRGKFLVWRDLLDQAAIDGESRVLDIGCGRGAVLTLVAGHLTTGRAVGIDLWRGSDQSGNSALATRRNAEAEGVDRRVDVCTADMRALPFADGTFDLIVSNIAIHNVPGRDNRARAIDEAVRVLRPGGRLMVADIFSTPQYRARLAGLGVQAVEQRNLGWRMWWGGPWMPTRLVTARKGLGPQSVVRSPSATLAWMSDVFEPHPRLRNGHVMTVWAWGRPRTFPRLPLPQDRVFIVAPDARVLGRCYWQPTPKSHPTLIALHGLEGSSEAHYMRGLADKAFAEGFNVVLLNQRNCGGTEHLSMTLYHSGLSADVDVVLRELSAEGHRAVVIAGYSLGGNLALKLAGDYGRDAPTALKAIAAVSPVMDLPRCVDALERRSNFFYQWNFVRNLKARMRRKAAAFPERFSTEALDRIRTVRQFDEAYTAPFFGFRDATDYYYRAAALRVVERIEVPTLIIVAGDDPFVPSDSFRQSAVSGNPHITLRVSAHGGHCAFIGPANGDGDSYWAERRVVDFLKDRVGP